MNPLKNLLIVVFALLGSYCIAQDAPSHFTVEGKIVQLFDNEKKAVSGVKISIPGQGSAMTEADGRFSIKVSSDLEYISLETSSSDLFLLPDRMNLPPPTHNLEIMLCCGEQVDPDFQERIDRLNAKIRKTEREKKLSQRQIIALQKVMFDTILHFQTELFLNQKTIEKLRAEQEDLQNENAELNSNIEQLTAANEKQRAKIEELEDKLYDALQEKFLRQQQHYKLVSEELQEYLDRIKDLRDWLAHIENYFGHPKGRQQFVDCINSYNTAWKTISLSHQTHIQSVENYWDEVELAVRLNANYDFLLHDLHEDLMLDPLRTSVLDPLTKYSNRKMGRGAALRTAKLGAKNILEQLNPMLDDLEYRINTIKKDLRTDVYASK